MKKYFTVLTFLFISFSILSQDFEGNYKDKADSLTFSNGEVVFNVGGFSGLSVNKKGEGTYEKIDDFLLIHTAEYSGDKTSMQELNHSKKDTLVIAVRDYNNSPVQGAYAEWLNNSGKSLGGEVSNERGMIFYKKRAKEKMKKIRIGSFGYDDIVFNYNPEKDYLIRLAGDNIIENQTVVFKIKEEDEETISIVLLSDDFDPGKDRTKSLNRLDKRAKRSNILPKRLKKEYVPIYRK